MSTTGGSGFRAAVGAALSLLYPGLGHILARRWGAGVSLLVISSAISWGFAALLHFLAPTPTAIAASVGLWLVAIAVNIGAAIVSFRLLWRGGEVARPNWYRSTWFAALVVIVASVAGHFALPWNWRTYSTPARSNVPTLLVGDYFVADARPFRPAIGDLVVFSIPDKPSVQWIKRIVAMPGDKVQMVEGRLKINGVIAPRAPVDDVRTAGPGDRTIDARAYRETLPGGVSHAIVEILGDAGPLDDTAEFDVPPGACFVLGDNRDNSQDSRTPSSQGGLGFVPLRNIVGKATTIFWSPDRARILQQIE